MGGHWHCFKAPAKRVNGDIRLKVKAGGVERCDVDLGSTYNKRIETVSLSFDVIGQMRGVIFLFFFSPSFRQRRSKKTQYHNF